MTQNTKDILRIVAASVVLTAVAALLPACAPTKKPTLVPPPAFSGVEQTGNVAAALKENHGSVRSGIVAAQKALDQ